LVDVVGRQTLDPEQMAVGKRGLGGASLHELGTIRRAVSPCNSDRENREASNPGSRKGRELSFGVIGSDKLIWRGRHRRVPPPPVVGLWLHVVSRFEVGRPTPQT
jgi:hypothetical protein